MHKLNNSASLPASMLTNTARAALSLGSVRYNTEPDSDGIRVADVVAALKSVGRAGLITPSEERAQLWALAMSALRVDEEGVADRPAARRAARHGLRTVAG